MIEIDIMKVIHDEQRRLTELVDRLEGLKPLDESAGIKVTAEELNDIITALISYKREFY